MAKDTVRQPDAADIWKKRRGTVTAQNDLDLILGSLRNLPVRYWRPFFFFKGVKDTDLLDWSDGRFPKTTVPGKTHPVIALKPLPDNSGYKASPCSSRRSFELRTQHYIRKGCRLLHTNRTMDRDAYVVEHIEVPIPVSIGGRLSYMGEVPAECVQKRAT